MSEPSTQASPQSSFGTFDTIVVAAVGLACLALLVWLVTPPPPVGFYWDDAWYLMMAEWISGRGEYRELVWNMLHLRQYPPLYPALLALSGATLAHPDPGFWINVIATTGAAVCLLIWLQKSEGMAMVAAVAASVALVLSPVALAWLPALFSEHLFVLLMVIALWSASVARRPGDWILLGLIAGLAIMTRSAGIALLCAIALSTALTRWRMLAWLTLGLAPALLLGWWLAHDMPSLPRYQSMLQSMTETLGSTSQLAAQVAAVTTGWKQIWGSAAGSVIALLAVLPGWYVRLRKHSADAWLVPVYLAMLVLWPYPGHMDRFLWPLLPALLVCAAETTRLFKSPVYRAVSLSVVPAVIVLGLGTGVFRSVSRVSNPPDPSLVQLAAMNEWTRTADPADAIKALQARRQLLLDMQRVQAMTPGGICIYSELPALVAVQAKRISQAGTWARLSELGDNELHCDFYYLMPLGLPGTTPEDIDPVAGQHEVLFRSPLPWDPSGPIPMGVLFKLDRD